MWLIRAAVVLVVVVGGCGAESAGGEPVGVVRSSTAPATTLKPYKAAGPTSLTVTARPPVATTKEVVEFRVIPFKKKTVTDDSLAKGETSVRTAGVNGTRRLVYRVTYVNGVQTAKKLIKQEVAKEPRSQVTVVGTKVEEPEESGGGCDPNYSGCVPIASDVDCSGGSGNGPEYVAGPIRVTGDDIYRLDADHDGIACE